MFFPHGTNHSRGVLIPVKDHWDFKLQSVKVDSEGYILLEALIQDSPFVLPNIFAPNTSTEQCQFFQKIFEKLKSLVTFSDFSLDIGGDLKWFLTKTSMKAEVRCQENEKKKNGQNTRRYLFGADLIDIWRVRNPTEKRFTWRQKTPIIQRRLDLVRVSLRMICRTTSFQQINYGWIRMVLLQSL